MRFHSSIFNARLGCLLLAPGCMRAQEEKLCPALVLRSDQRLLEYWQIKRNALDVAVCLARWAARSSSRTGGVLVGEASSSSASYV